MRNTRKRDEKEEEMVMIKEREVVAGRSGSVERGDEFAEALESCEEKRLKAHEVGTADK